MYEINEKNLRFAYLKLKRFAYYYSSSNYLKDKIIFFEDHEKNNPNVFKEYAEKLNAIGKTNYDCLHGYSFNFLYYPKKDSISLKNNMCQVSNINIFADMDLMFYLNDILFCLELYETYKLIKNEYFFGNLFDKHLERCDEPLENAMLFDNYWPNYQKWKKSITKKINSKTAKNSTLIKLDFQRCFYQTRFRIDTFLNKYNINQNNPIVHISKNIYRLFSYALYKYTGDDKQNQMVQLPLGLPSASIIQNILFSDFDLKMANHDNVIGYSRYVDDVLLLIEGKIDTKEEIQSVINDIRINVNDNKIRVNVNDEFLDSLVLSAPKLEIKRGTSLNDLMSKIDKINLPSMLDLIDEEASEIDSETSLIEDSLSQVYIKKKINRMFEFDENPSGMMDFLGSLKDDNLLNAYSCWNKILCILKKDGSLYEIFIDRLKNIIDRVEYLNEDNFFIKDLIKSEFIKNTLNRDLSTSIRLNENNKYYLFNVRQEDIFECISKGINEKRLFFPIYIKLEYIELFMSMNDTIDENFFEKCTSLYEYLNYIKLNDSHIVNDIKISKIIDSDLTINDDGGYVIDKKFSTLYSIGIAKSLDEINFDPIKVAIMSIDMPEKTIEDCDINGMYPREYSFFDILKGINEAKKHKAKYVLLPEFCLPYKDMLRIIKICIERKISIITGLTHFLDKSKNLASNFILIYNSNLKLALLKRKNYYPYKEKLLLAKNGYKPFACNPYYLLIDDGIIRYSTMTCYEATNIRDRSFLNNKINVLYIPVYNKDTTYFSEIVGSVSRDLSSFVVQANNSEYGDSRISGPLDEFHKDLVKIKGGENCFTVIGSLDIFKMIEKHYFMDEINDEIDELILEKNKDEKYKEICKKISDNKRENNFKPLSAGNE